ncbi:MAG: hypothetical protein SGBAC_002091 [Bacillariaceae sp.]
MKYSQVGNDLDERHDGVSVASSKRKFRRHRRVNSGLSEPLTAADSVVDESLGSGAVSGDPYFVFRSDLQDKLELVDDALADFLRVVHETDTAINTHELKDARKKLKRHLKNAESTIRDVQATVQAVENARDKFEYIDDSQLFERKSLVNTSRDRISKAKEEITSEAVKLKMLEDEKNKAIRRSGDGLLGATTDVQRHNSDFVLNSQAQSSVMMQQQDETLDELGDVVMRVGEMAENIHEEIEMQNQMLDELDEDMTKVEEELGMVMGKLAVFLKTKNKCHLRTILTLSLVVVVLFFLVIYT